MSHIAAISFCLSAACLCLNMARNNINCHIWSLTASLCLSVCLCCILTNSLSCSPISAPHNWNNLRQSRKKEKPVWFPKAFLLPFYPNDSFHLQKSVKWFIRRWEKKSDIYALILQNMFHLLSGFTSLHCNRVPVTDKNTHRNPCKNSVLYVFSEVRTELSASFSKNEAEWGAEWTKAKLGRHTDSRLGSRCCWHRTETRSENH